VTVSAARPALSALAIADPPERWRALGFTVDEHDCIHLGEITLQLGGAGSGITAWTISGIDPAITDLDGLPTDAGALDGLPTDAGATPTTAAGAPPTAHPNSAAGLDHVVIITPDFDRTAAALAAADIPLRRVRDAGRFRQGFRRLGPAILELVESPDAPPGPARFWGLTVIVTDLDALKRRLQDLLTDPRPAVQPGRRIAALREAGRLSPRVAFMDPEPGPAAPPPAP
jgi:hypothetical protein